MRVSSGRTFGAGFLRTTVVPSSGAPSSQAVNIIDARPLSSPVCSMALVALLIAGSADGRDSVGTPSFWSVSEPAFWDGLHSYRSPIA